MSNYVGPVMCPSLRVAMGEDRWNVGTQNGRTVYFRDLADRRVILEIYQYPESVAVLDENGNPMYADTQYAIRREVALS